MGSLLHIFPPSFHFPFGRSFQIRDQYNGPKRGTWFFRCPHADVIYGPYMTEGEAEYFRFNNPSADSPA